MKPNRLLDRLPLAKGIARVLILTVCVSLLSLSTIHAQGVSYAVQDGLIKIGNAYYEIAFSTANGGITTILDKSTGQKISDGDRDGSLWAATLDQGDPVSATDGKFSYSWDTTADTLSLTYTGSVAVTVTVRASDSPALKMQANVTNGSSANVTNFSFPNGLQVATADISDGLLPLLPGTLISPTFFAKKGVYVDQYPGAMFADYLAVRSAKGKLALYSQRGDVVQPALIGFDATNSPDSQLTHNYRTWIAPTKTWSTPWLVIRVGQDYPDTIAGYRMDNGIDKYKSLTDKLGSAAPAFFAAPMYKLDLSSIGLPFKALKSTVIDKLNVPGLIEFVVIQRGGHDHNYPNFIPPDPRWGTTQDFADLVQYIHAKGSLAMPYTNFSWWDPNSALLRALPAGTKLTDLVTAKAGGLINIEKAGPNAGFVVNLHNSFVQNTIAQQHDALVKTVGMDAVLEDQWGARNAPYDFNPAGLEVDDPSTSYFEGVLDHYRALSGDNLMTEVGVDALANDGVGFMGTNYLWDMLGYRGATASTTTYYPMAGMMLRDKVLLYQHNLADQTWTKDKDMLRWNLAQGYDLSNAFYGSSFDMDNPWLNVAGIFQKYALSNYADELVSHYDDLGNGVKRTAFSTYTVYSDWSTDQPYTVSGDTLPAGGVVTMANDGSVTAGVFTGYNGSALSSGEHYLVEVRSARDIRLFQPLGGNTPISLKALSTGAVKVTAYGYDGNPLSEVNAVTNAGMITLDYAGNINGQIVAYYQITAQGQTF